MAEEPRASPRRRREIGDCAATVNPERSRRKSRELFNQDFVLRDPRRRGNYMITYSLESDRNRLAWDPKRDFNYLQELAAAQSINLIHAIPEVLRQFKTYIHDSFASFIAELRPDNEHALTNTYFATYQDMLRMISLKTQQTEGLDDTHLRAQKIQNDFQIAISHLLSHPDSQAIVISPVNKTEGGTEYKYTALYLLTSQKDKEGYIGQMLFTDFTQEEQEAFLKVYPPLESKIVFPDMKSFLVAVGDFLEVHRGHKILAGKDLSDVDQFIREEQKLKQENRAEAAGWVEEYAKLIAVGAINSARSLITKLQMKVLGLKKSDIFNAIRNVGTDLKAALLFLRDCGTLEFAFNSIEPGIGASTSLISEGLVHCPVCDPQKTKEKVHCPPGHSCPRCHTLRQCG